MRRHHTKLRSTVTQAAVVLTLVSGASMADVFQFNSKQDWDSWAFPPGVLVQNDNGSITLSRVDEAINAASNATEFLHTVKRTRDPVPGGVRGFSNEESVGNLIDGLGETYWQPSQADVIDDWWVEVDLGRMVNATKIRLTFPDTTDAVPFRNFSVYVNDGERSTAAKDIFQFTRVGRTTSPNESRVVEYELSTFDPGPATGEHLLAVDTLSFAPVQYVRFVPEEIHDGAALAEIEVEALGDNVALGTVGRGGSVRAGTSQGNSALFSDGDHNTTWALSGAISWEENGHWYEWDLGATFWLNRMVVEVGAPIVYGGNAVIKDMEISTSDGTQSGGLTTDRIRSNFDYDLLSLIDASKTPVRAIYDLQFEPRKTRHIFFRRSSSFEPARKIFYLVVEHALYGDGYVAEVEMVSDFIDLGGTSSIRRLTWDAELPAGTYVEIRTQTGDTFVIREEFYNKNGVAISEAQWNKLPKSQKLDIVELQLPGTDWSGWSQVYAEPEGVFLSPSPRRYVQLQVKLGNDNPDVAPLLRDISLHFDDALISGGVTSRIHPRQVEFDSLQTFTYVLNPVFRFGDQGFDRIRIQTPSPVGEVSVRVAGDPVLPAAVAMLGDSLQIDLPERVQGDSVEVEFQARIQSNATLFDSWVSVAGEDLLQGVRPAQQHASTVFVPSIATGGKLIRQVGVSSVFTPNGDGVNDLALIDFSLAKVETSQPTVSIHDLSGRHLRVVAAGADGFRWDGRDDSGEILPPGAYICKISLAADIGEQTAHRIINLAY